MQQAAGTCPPACCSFLSSSSLPLTLLLFPPSFVSLPLPAASFGHEKLPQLQESAAVPVAAAAASPSAGPHGLRLLPRPHSCESILPVRLSLDASFISSALGRYRHVHAGMSGAGVNDAPLTGETATSYFQPQLAALRGICARLHHFLLFSSPPATSQSHSSLPVLFPSGAAKWLIEVETPFEMLPSLLSHQLIAVPQSL